MFVIENLSRIKSVFFSDGTARRIEFTLTLKRTDENLKEMFGDLSQQLNDLSGALSDTLGGLLS
ncbi:Phage P2 GpU [Sodalis glossinidius str. 'morsitans']|nr:Phage P2 GpU [Sodalis glossinidius str. 'morsitans']